MGHRLGGNGISINRDPENRDCPIILIFYVEGSLCNKYNNLFHNLAVLLCSTKTYVINSIILEQLDRASP